MEFTGEHRIPAPRDSVWAGLNDPLVLKQCIDGCEELAWSGDNEMSAKVRAKVGPVSARFNGKVTLTDVEAPRRYTLVGQGQGGAAGFAKGQAHVELEEDGTDTVLRYRATAQVGGKLASVGSRLIQGVADKTAADFFQKFSAIMSGEAPAAGTAPEAEAPAEEPAISPETAAAAREAAPAVHARPPERGPVTPHVGEERPARRRMPVNASTVIIPLGWLFMLLVLLLVFVVG